MFYYRTLANRYEGQTYAYFTVAFWSVILTIMYIIEFAYIALLYPLYIVSGASGNVLQVRSRALLCRPWGDRGIGAWPSHLTTCEVWGIKLAFSCALQDAVDVLVIFGAIDLFEGRA